MKKSNKLVISSRVDPRTLGNIARYLTENEKAPESQSELVYKGLLVLSKSLIEQGMVEPIGSDAEAIEYLTSIGITWGRNAKSRKKVESLLKGKPASLDNAVDEEPVTTPKQADPADLKEYMDKIAKEIGG